MTFFIIAAVAVLFVLCIAYTTYRMAFYSPRNGQNDIHNIPDGEQYQAGRDKMIKMIDDLAAIPFERVYITSHDGLRLSGRYYHTTDGAPVDICFHGYRATSVRDFSGGAMLSLENGRNLLLVDQRAQGESEGHTITFGIKERHDCLRWVEYVIERFGAVTRIMLYGISMGGATVLMASGLPLPPNVRGIVADCPYSSAKDIIIKVCRDMHIPPTLAYPFLALGARLYGGISLSKVTAAQAVKSAKVPIVIIHGEDDRFVPCDMSRDIELANPTLITRHTFPGAAHGLSFMADFSRYRGIVEGMWKIVE